MQSVVFETNMNNRSVTDLFPRILAGQRAKTIYSLTTAIGTITTVETVPTEIHSPKFTEIKSLFVAFQVGVRFQWPIPAEIVSFFQSEND